jgi:hypothetical protein
MGFDAALGPGGCDYLHVWAARRHWQADNPALMVAPEAVVLGADIRAFYCDELAPSPTSEQWERLCRRRESVPEPRPGGGQGGGQGGGAEDGPVDEGDVAGR